MPAAIDLTGQKFGRLTAVSVYHQDGKRLWRFMCDCGNEKITSAGPVRYGTTLSCGCLRKETTAKSRAVDLVGTRVGRLTVLSKLPERNKHRQVMWSCRCDCGTSKVLSTHQLNKASPTQSCGCIKRELMRALGASSKKENPISRTPAYKAALRKKKRSQPHFAMAERVSRMLAWALASVGAVKRGRTFDMLGYTPAELKTHLERQFTKGMNWENRNLWEIDHIIPISSAKSTDDVIALNQLSNLRPMWAADNNSKKNKILTLL